MDTDRRVDEGRRPSKLSWELVRRLLDQGRELEKRRRRAYEASTWLARLERGTAGDGRALAEWLKADPAHARELLGMAAIDQELAHLDPEHRHDVEALLAGESANIVELYADRRPPAAPPARPTRVMALAASLIMFVLGLPALLPVLDRDYASAAGEHRRVQLLDGSAVELNAGTRIRVLSRVDRREIELLAGEVLLDVRRDPARRSFLVRAGGARVQVLGTRFGISAAEGGRLTVYVLRGHVRVEISGARAELGAGEEASVFRDRRGARMQVREIGLPALERRASWAAGPLVLVNVPLAEVVRRVNRYHTDRLVLEDAELGAVRVGFNFDPRNLESIIAALEYHYGLEARISGDPGAREIRLVRRP